MATLPGEPEPPREVTAEHITAYLKKAGKGRARPAENHFYTPCSFAPQTTKLKISKERRLEKKTETIYGRPLHKLMWHKDIKPVNDIDPTLSLDAFPEKPRCASWRKDLEKVSKPLRSPPSLKQHVSDDEHR